jgi:hypothetical protein
MKGVFLSLGLVASAYANIKFKHVELRCSLSDPRINHGCLEGQTCDGRNCTSAGSVSARSFPVVVPGLNVRAAVYSTDGTCGPANGNTICDPNSTVYTGSCCSEYGWCGGDDAHCGAGCISGPCTTSGSTGGTAPRADGRCGSVSFRESRLKCFETDIPRLLVVLHVMLKVHLVAAVHPTDSAAPLQITASSPMVAKMDALMVQAHLQHCLLHHPLRLRLRHLKNQSSHLLHRHFQPPRQAVHL